jgi:hypothetical protein
MTVRFVCAICGEEMPPMSSRSVTVFEPVAKTTTVVDVSPCACGGNAVAALLSALEDMVGLVEYLAPEAFDDDEHERNFNARLDRARAAIQSTRGEA